MRVVFRVGEDCQNRYADGTVERSRAVEKGPKHGRRVGRNIFVRRILARAERVPITGIQIDKAIDFVGIASPHVAQLFPSNGMTDKNRSLKMHRVYSGDDVIAEAIRRIVLRGERRFAGVTKST